MGVFYGNTEYEDHFRHCSIKKFLGRNNNHVKSLVITIENIERLKLFQLGGKSKNY